MAARGNGLLNLVNKTHASLMVTLVLVFVLTSVLKLLNKIAALARLAMM